MAKEKEGALKFISPKGHIRDRIKVHQTPEIPKQGAFISLNGYPWHNFPEHNFENTSIHHP